MRYLGIDYGTKRIGLALSDESGLMGFPHGVIDNAPPALETILTLMTKQNVNAVVMGESRTLSGIDNKIAKDARSFANVIKEKSGKEVFYESEVFTSSEARRQFDQGEKSRAPKVHAHVDASAAALILTSFLSHHGQAKN